jgi:hypothetical protein
MPKYGAQRFLEKASWAGWHRAGWSANGKIIIIIILKLVRAVPRGEWANGHGWAISAYVCA